MKDFRKFCRPKTTKNPQVGDVLIRLNCGEKVFVSLKDFKNILKFFKIKSFNGETLQTPGSIATSKFGKLLTLSPENYNNVKDLFEFLGIVGEKLLGYVDMGLPSGTLWASCDIDLTKPGGFCETPFTYQKSFFSWGNIDGHNPVNNSFANVYNWGSGNEQEPWYDGQPYGNTPGNTLTGNIAVGEAFDAARANLGTPWRMPTTGEYAELFANIIYINADGTEVDTTKADKRVTVNGVLGLYIQSKINGNRLFFSCSGFGYGASWNYRGSYGDYWSSSFFSARYARYLFLSSSGVAPQSYNGRYYGFAVRAVATPTDLEKEIARAGDIICHNSILNRDAIFSYNNWIQLDDSWEATGLFEIETFEYEDEVTELRNVILSNGTTFVIKASDYSKVSDYWEVVETLDIPNLHEYVDLGLPSGTKWATMNIGANSVTDLGLYFQWGDTQGYAADQVGSGEGLKYFGWGDYKYASDSSGEASSMTKYNTTDGKTILEAEDDAAVANWGGGWRMPTDTEFNELINNTNSELTTINEIFGYKFTCKTDESKYIFLPAAGQGWDGYSGSINYYGFYWAKVLSDNLTYAKYFDFEDHSLNQIERCIGFSVRPVLDE